MSFEPGLLEVEIPFVARNSLKASIRFFMLYQKLTCLDTFPGIMCPPTNVLISREEKKKKQDILVQSKYSRVG